MIDYLVCSEYATLKFLETTKVPAPKAFGYGLCGSGEHVDVGVSSILTEELQWKPWIGQGSATRDASEEDKRKIWSGLADIMMELKRHPFTTAGSLQYQSSHLVVSGVASDRFGPYGPFKTGLAYYTAFAEQYLELFADNQLYTEYPINAYLVYSFLKERHPAGSASQRDRYRELLPQTP